VPPYFTKGLLYSYANRRKIQTREPTRNSVKKARCLLPFRCLFTNDYAYRNYRPTSIILQFSDRFYATYKTRKKLRYVCLTAHREQLLPLDRFSLILDYRLDDLRFDSRQDQDFSLQNVQTCYGARLASYSMGMGNPSPGVKRTECQVTFTCI
jgi:hypothetical protein